MQFAWGAVRLGQLVSEWMRSSRPRTSLDGLLTAAIIARTRQGWSITSPICDGGGGGHYIPTTFGLAISYFTTFLVLTNQALHLTFLQIPGSAQYSSSV
ncbi:hypothetical protein J6590_003964 [Homalodisca vitripennis]|nr:hypothetical protein J6590_003964 [Homalodisca vitripennis]